MNILMRLLLLVAAFPGIFNGRLVRDAGAAFSTPPPPRAMGVAATAVGTMVSRPIASQAAADCPSLASAEAKIHEYLNNY